MCAVDGESRFDCVISDLDHNAICEIGFKFITLLCRFLDQFDFNYGNLDIISTKDHSVLDPLLLLSIWRNE